ncbi:hypothetical protein ACMFMG_011589 [Clarireedia jacksonii]
MGSKHSAYEELLSDNHTSTKARKVEKWDDEQHAKLREVVEEVEKEYGDSISGGKRALFKIVAERLKTYGIDRTDMACLARWSRIEPATDEDPKTVSSHDTLWEVSSSEYDEPFAGESDSDYGAWGTPNVTKHKAATNSSAKEKQSIRRSLAGRSWTAEEELIIINRVITQKNKEKSHRLKSILTAELFASIVNDLKEKGYTRTPAACRQHWHKKMKDQLKTDALLENSTNFVTSDALPVTPQSTSNTQSNDSVVSGVMVTDEAIASEVESRSTSRLSEESAPSNQEQAASDIESSNVQILYERPLDNRVEVSPQQQSLLEAAFSRGNYFTPETFSELGRSTGLAKHQIKTWFYKKRHANDLENEVVKKFEKDSATPMAQLDEAQQGNNWTSKRSRTSDIINTPLGHESVSPYPRPPKKARYSHSGESSISGERDTTDVKSKIGHESTPLSNQPGVTASDSREHSIEKKASSPPGLDETPSTSLSPKLKEELENGHNVLKSKISLAEKNEEHLKLAIADHGVRIDVEKKAKAQMKEQLVRLELVIADHDARIDAEKKAQAQKKKELERTQESKRGDTKILKHIDELLNVR